MVQAVTFDHRADQWRSPKQNSSTAWLTITDTTDTIVYRIIFVPSGDRARSFSAVGETGIRFSVPARRRKPHIMFARAMAPSHAALGLGLRWNVDRSTSISPNSGR